MEIKKWNPDFTDDSKHFSMLICGSRRQGKSYYFKHLYNTHLKNRFHMVCVMTTCQGIDVYSEFIPGDLIMEDFRPDVLQALFDKQAGFLDNHNTMPHILVVLDDVVTNDMKKSEEMKKLFTTGRHMNISICILIQDMMLVSVTARENLDYLLLTRQKTARSKNYLVENFMSDLIDEDDLPQGTNERKYIKQLITKSCVDYNIMVIDFNSNSDKFEDLVFMTRA